MNTATSLRPAGVDVVVVADRPIPELAASIDAAAAGTAFRVLGLTRDGHRAKVRFVADGLAVGWGTILDLQHRLVRTIEVVSVQRLTGVDLVSASID